MSGTASRRSERRLSRALFVAWVSLLAVAALALVYAPVQEILIIEVVIFSFAVLYGFGVWDVCADGRVPGGLRRLRRVGDGSAGDER